jgi:hypothetical protein
MARVTLAQALVHVFEDDFGGLGSGAARSEHLRLLFEVLWDTKKMFEGSSDKSVGRSGAVVE